MDGMAQINWTDCELASLVEIPADDRLILNVAHAERAQAHEGTRSAIIFNGFHAIEVNESPGQGLPRMVDAEVVAWGGGYFTLRIETTMGFRVVSARTVRLVPGWQFG